MTYELIEASLDNAIDFSLILICLLQIVKFVEEEKGNLAIQANQYVECVCTNTGDEGWDEKEDRVKWCDLFSRFWLW